MITSIPTSALKLGIDFKEYEELCKNVGRMSAIPKYKRQKILERADEGLSLDKDLAFCLIKDMAYDRKVYEIAGLNYAEGPPEGEKLFITALADYLLKHKKNNKYQTQ